MESSKDGGGPSTSLLDDLLKEKRIKVFLPDENLVWVTADIITEVKQGHFDVEVTDEDFPKGSGRRKVITMKSLCRPMDVLPLQNEHLEQSGVNDMIHLNYLHEASILDNLRRRFAHKLPYTYTGDICIAVNPYHWLDIYTEQLQESHKEKMRHESPPHAYSTSSVAYRGLRDYAKNQSILVSGESGAGKTETVKILMSHLAHISGRKNDKTIAKVLEANPLLESFGNAKTARNDNSSRFGKFTQLQFDQFTVLAGSKCVTYLLEKSRVVTQNDLERNYHIFHQVFASPDAFKQSLFLSNMNAASFRYTSRGDTTTKFIEGVSDGDRFAQTMGALELLGVGKEKRELVTRILAGILFLGEVVFTGDSDKSSVTVDPNAEKCCALLGLSVADFANMTTVRNIEVSGQRMTVHLSLREASDGRDALAKDIYEHLFQWLVLVVNDSTSASAPGIAEQNRTISLLDIFGFESFKVNRFEQLCINFANEKLQQKFTQDVFQTVQEEYKSEGLEWELISYKDNSDVLDLLEGRLGVWAMLNEECLMPQGSDGKYLGKLSSACSRHPCFGTSVHMARDEFSIQHFAGKVLYNVTGFVERNRDALPSEMKALMQTSKNDVLCQIYSLDVAAVGETDSSSFSAEGGSSRDSSSSSSRPRGSFSQGRSSSQPQRRASFMKADTVTTKFRAQLLQLMEVISLTDVQYVRCIKPNSKKSKELFDRNMVVGQLRCAGMIEAIRISRAAYPYRITHSDFTERFGGLRSGSWLRRHGGTSPLSQCKALLEDVLPPEMQPSGSGSKDKQYELGKTRVYFSSGVLEHLESVRGNLIFRHIGSIQRVWRGTSVRRWYLHLRRSAVLTQAAVRGFLARLLAFKARFAILMTQTLFRGWRARRRFRKMQIAYLTVKLQSWARMVPLRRFFVRLRRAASTVGARVKMRLQRKKFVEMLHEARENAKMATQLDALRRRLQDEAAQRAALENEVKRAAAAAAAPASFSSSSHSALAVPTNEIEALEHLRSELGKQQRRVEHLAAENESLRQGLRGGTRLMDLKEGALAVGRVALEDLEREKAHLVTEKDKMARVNAQYNLEKSVLMDSLLELGNDVDEAQRKTAEFFRRFIAERQIRKAQHQATCDFLAARGVGSDILAVRSPLP